MERGDWAQEQIARVHGPIYEAKRLKLAAKKRRAKFDGRVEYRLYRRVLRRDAHIICGLCRDVYRDVYHRRAY